jgi:hypothetical protein
MQSNLPITGKCHYCGKPTPRRFCDRNCGNNYTYRKNHPIVIRTRKSKDVYFTDKRLTDAQIAANIERVVAQAKERESAGHDVVRDYQRGTTLKCWRVG